MDNITPQDMQRLQTENYNVFAETARPVLLNNIDESKLTADEKKYIGVFRNWNLRNDPGEAGPVIFSIWYDSLEHEVWSDEFSKVNGKPDVPDEPTLIEGLLRDSVFKFVDNINTPATETLPEVVTAAFKKAVPVFMKADKNNRLAWGQFKNTRIRHLLRLHPFSRINLDIGGGVHIINATKDFHGPSWRMIVHLTDETEAYGVYPAGQNGNPGSKYYDNFIDTWMQGRYYPLWFMKKDQANDKRVIAKMNFSKG
jgi:penicillin amidase